MLREKVNYVKKIDLRFTKINTYKSTEKAIVEDILIDTIPGENISCFLVKPKAGNKYPGVIFFHWLEPQAENSNKTEFLPLAIALAEDNKVASILLDGFWANRKTDIGWKTESKNDLKLNEKQLIKLLYVIDFFESLEFVNREKLIFCGHDFGAMFGTLLGSFKPEIRAFIFMALTGKFSDWYRFGNNLNSVDDYLTYANDMSLYDPVTNIKDIKREILFQFALNDFYVPVEKALELINQTSVKPFVKWYKANHAMNDESFADVKKFILQSFNL